REVPAVVVTVVQGGVAAPGHPAPGRLGSGDLLLVEEDRLLQGFRIVERRRLRVGHRDRGSRHASRQERKHDRRDDQRGQRVRCPPECSIRVGWLHVWPLSPRTAGWRGIGSSRRASFEQRTERWRATANALPDGWIWGPRYAFVPTRVKKKER